MSFSYRIFLDLAIILLATKVLGMVMRRIGLPQVVGALLAGILVGPMVWGSHALVSPSDNLKVLAEIGVVMLMFSAGLETNLKDIKQNGVASLVITAFGVIVPLGLGFVIAAAFNGGFANMTQAKALQNLFFGVILTATSVGITVETLKEMGKLKGKVGTSILSAAILDDIIGIIILSVIIGMSGGNTEDSFLSGANMAPFVETFLLVLLFFIVTVAAGFGLHYLFKYLAKKYPNKRRVPIFSLVVCFFFAWLAEGVFHIADITGAYLAGIMLSNIKTTEYVERKIDINSYMIFSPVFFASIGINASMANFDISIIWFAMCFVLMGLLGKVLGCGGAAKICGYSTKDSLRVGLGMMARGEVCLIVANKGIDAGLISSEYIVVVLMLVIFSALLTPILMKLTYKGKWAEPLAEGLSKEMPLPPKPNNSTLERPFDMTDEAFLNSMSQELDKEQYLQSINQLNADAEKEIRDAQATESDLKRQKD